MIKDQTLRITTKFRFVIVLILAGFLFFSCSPLKNYKDLQEVKAWEPDIAKFEALDKTEKYSPDAIMFAGSSSIRLWTTLAEDMKPFDVIQRGYGGSKLGDFAVYADRIFSPHPCKALVMFIANDITGSAQDKTPEEVNRLFLYVLKTFRKTHPDTPFFWIAVTPTESRWKVWPQIQEVNRLIRQSCEKHKNTYFIETEKAFLNEKGEPKSELFVSDKLHLNKDGYVVWNRIIKAELERVLLNGGISK